MSARNACKTLNHVFELYIPTQCRCGRPLPRGSRSETFLEAQQKMGNWFGGGGVGKPRVDPIEGIWSSEDGELVSEDVDVISSGSNGASYEAYREEFCSYAAELANRLTQEAVACRIDDRMLIFPSTDRYEPKKHRCAVRPGVRTSPTPSPTKPTNLDRRRAIQAALLRLDGVEQARELFCNVLHYGYEDGSLPTTKWPENLKECLVGMPRVVANQNGFRIIYLKLPQNRLLRSQERPIIQRIVRDDPTIRGLFVVSDIDENEWHLINVKFSKKDSAKTGAIIRRLRVGPREHMRTPVERLAMLDIEVVGEQADPQRIQEAHDEAFDVQKVTKEFFGLYREVFYEVEATIKGFGRSKAEREAKHLFTQQLFNRLMFIAFVQKKGWLSINGDTDYLNALWEDYRRKKAEGRSFYDQRLTRLFFGGLSDPRRGRANSRFIGSVPFLNGGLFEKDEDDKRDRLAVPDKSVRRILFDLFVSFNFTVNESTPLDQEVAVDPEMLGSIFEELVTGRHEQGAYYTPKPIVSFMCREALKGCLKAKCPNESGIAISEFVENHDTSLIKKPEALLDALGTVTVCDPACGSGAYLLGMLHELIELRDCLFAVHKIGAREVFARKLEIIQANLYGVDLDQFAVNIARLRLWLL